MNRFNIRWRLLAVGSLSLAFVLQAAPMSSAAEEGATPAVKGFLLEEEPEDAQDVVAVRKKAKNAEDVVVVGRIGGRKTPWVKGAAAFSIVDATITACSEIPGDRCPTPWDFCCEADLPSKTVLVTFVDEAGKIVKKDARALLKVKELQTVVVKGKVKRDVTGNVSILASSLFVREEKEEKPVVK
jgi:hypothetical protein